MILGYEGNTAVYVFDAEKRQNYRLQRDKWIDSASEVIELLKDKYGEENVKLV